MPLKVNYTIRERTPFKIGDNVIVIKSGAKEAIGKEAIIVSLCTIGVTGEKTHCYVKFIDMDMTEYNYLNNGRGFYTRYSKLAHIK